MRTWIRYAGAIAIAASLGSAASALQITQTFNMPLTPTDIGGGTGTGTFDYWQDVAPLNSVLDSVQLRISVTAEMSALSVTNNDFANPQTFSYLSYSNVTPVGTAPAGDQTALNTALFLNGGSNGDVDLIDTGPVLYAPGQTIVYAPPSIFGSDDTLFVSAASIVPYDTTGQFTLGFTTTTVQAFVGGGGNGSNLQSTDAIGTVQVVYNYHLVPEPSTLVLGGMGLVGLIAVVRRRRTKA